MTSSRERSPGVKLVIAAAVGAALLVPLLMVYALIYDRQAQSETARAAIAEGWGDAQTFVGPILVIPYDEETITTSIQDNAEIRRAVTVERQLFLSPVEHDASVAIDPERRRISIYDSVVYSAGFEGDAEFRLPDDLERYGLSRDQLKLDRAEIRLGISDARGLLTDNQVSVNGDALDLQPGRGLGETQGSGFFAFVDWTDADAALAVSYTVNVRGHRAMALVPHGNATQLSVQSAWPHPSFGGAFLPSERTVNPDGFTARYAITSLALGEGLVRTDDAGQAVMADARGVTAGDSAVRIALIDPVNLYSQVDRAVKYGFLFVGFTFLAFLMFDLIGGARVAAAEYLLTGAGLVLFFVLLLALAEIIGFMIAYGLAAGSIIALLTSYSAAVLGGWTRASFIGVLLTALYAVLYVLLNLQAYSLLIGALLLFVALAAVMFLTRRIDWGAVGRRAEEEA